LARFYLPEVQRRLATAFFAWVCFRLYGIGFHLPQDVLGKKTAEKQKIISGDGFSQNQNFKNFRAE
jgi:hypothetical protein